MAEDNVAIRVDGVVKNFKLPHERQTSIKGLLIHFLRRGRRTFENQKVLRDVSFEVKSGEFFGIVGRNGSGKSTLLKLLAGIYYANKGAVRVNGTLTPFIELGVGFNPELTGRENVFLNGALLGLNRKAMSAMYPDIVEFAELERFMDQKLKNYSSGMQVRLAFSIAIKAQSDILLIDEVLAVGDAAFQKKCFEYFMKLKRDKRTVILVTHDMAAVRQYCDRAIMIEDGKIVQEGRVEKVAQAYQMLFNDSPGQTNSGDLGDENRWGTGKIKAMNVRTKVSDRSVEIQVAYKANQVLDDLVFGFNVFNSRGMNILEGNTIREKAKVSRLDKGQNVSLTWTFPNVLAEDTYSVSVSSCNQAISEFYDWYNEAATFSVTKEGNTAATIDPPLTVRVEA